jgi:hypothetical protein
MCRLSAVVWRNSGSAVVAGALSSDVVFVNASSLDSRAVDRRGAYGSSSLDAVFAVSFSEKHAGSRYAVPQRNITTGDRLGTQLPLSPSIWRACGIAWVARNPARTAGIGNFGALSGSKSCQKSVYRGASLRSDDSTRMARFVCLHYITLLRFAILRNERIEASSNSSSGGLSLPHPP